MTTMAARRHYRMRAQLVPPVAAPAAAPAVFNVTFDRRSAVPLYRQLKFHVVHAISTGRLQPGAALPSVRALCRGLALASATVQRAYAELQSEGYVVAESGRGMFVGVLEDYVDPNHESRERALTDVLLAPIAQAQAMGFTGWEIVAVARRLAVIENSAPFSPRIVFVGRNADAVAKYTHLLRLALVATRAEILGIELKELQRNDGAVLDELRPVHRVVTLVSNFARVRTPAHRRGIETSGLMVELSEDTKRALIELPYESRVALVAERIFLSNTRAVVEQIRGHQADAVWATERDSKRLTERLANSNVVLHSLGTTELARRHAPASARLIELTFLPMAASLAHLAETVAAISPDHTDEAQAQT